LYNDCPTCVINMANISAQGEKALEIGETPVGCVLVFDGKVIGSGMNDTNRSMNVSFHNLLRIHIHDESNALLLMVVLFPKNYSMFYTLTHENGGLV
jgi:tRNA(Arg) A34 adenosine deaminase TadA